MFLSTLKDGEMSIAEDVFSFISLSSITTFDPFIKTYPVYSLSKFSLIEKQLLKRSIRIEQWDGDVLVTIKVSMKYGENIPARSLDLQRMIKQDIEDMTGVHVRTVNIIVEALIV